MMKKSPFTKRGKIKRILICLAGMFITSFLFCAPAKCETGLTAGQILNTQMGARSSAMGRAFTAVSAGSESLFYNPGSLAFVSSASVSITYMKGFDDGRYGFLATTLPKWRHFAPTVGMMYFNSGLIDLNLSNGTQGKVTAGEDKVVYLSVANSFLSRFGAGGTIKYARLTLAEMVSASSFNYDFGIFYNAGAGFTFGASYINGGQDIKFEETGDPPPRTTRLGAAYKTAFNPPNLLDASADLNYCELVLSVDRVAVTKEKAYYQAGAELNMGMPLGPAIGPILSLRAGYLGGQTIENIVFGLGFGKNNWAFDYSIAPSEELDPRQQATLTYSF